MNSPEQSKISLLRQLVEARQLFDKYFKEKKLRLFLGAGFSLHSGIPLVYAFLTEILQKNFQMSSEDVEAIFCSQFPFESIMQIFSSRSDITDLIKCFAGEGLEPNNNHLIMAACCESITTIGTTNFDPFIEYVLKQSGIEHTMISQPEQFACISHTEGIPVIKIHGCTENPETMIITMDAMVQKSMYANRLPAVEYVFSGNEDSLIVIMGYSCSDVFSTSPQIESLGKNIGKVLLIQHDDTLKVEEIAKQKHKNPLKHAEGFRLFGDHDQIIQYFAKRYNINVCDKPSQFGNSNWKIFVKEWADTLSPFNKYMILAHIYFNISDYQRALKTCQDALEEHSNNIEYFDVCNLMMRVQVRLGKYVIVKESLEKVMEKLQADLDNDKNKDVLALKSELLYTKALIYLHENKYEAAMQSLSESDTCAESSDNQKQIMMNMYRLAHIMYRISLDASQKNLPILHEDSYKSMVSRVNQVINDAKQMGHKYLELYAEMALADLYEIKLEHAKAKNLWLHVITESSDLGNITIKGIAYANLAELAMNEEVFDTDSVRSNLNYSLSIAESTGNVDEQMRSLDLLIELYKTLERQAESEGQDDVSHYRDQRQNYENQKKTLKDHLQSFVC